jgi:hypothetical protein
MEKWKKITVITFLVITVACLLMSGCGQMWAKKWGGTINITLNPGERLEMITWKEGGNLWLQVRARGLEEKAIRHEFREYSNLGLVEGKVVVQEK